MINRKKIICDNCKDQNLFDAYNKEFFKCLSCGQKLCPLCKSNHDKNHILVFYAQQNYICKKHNEYYIKYCKECRINICFLCENEHKNHDNEYYSNIMPNYNQIKEKNNDLKKSIETFKKNLKDIITKLDAISYNMEICDEINSYLLDNVEIRNRNYEDLQNINEINSNILNMLE